MPKTIKTFLSLTLTVILFELEENLTLAYVNYSPFILFSFGAIGFINSLIVSVYFLINKSYAKISNRLFGLFLLVLSFRVLLSIFYAFSNANSVWYINVGPAFFFLIGPLLFTYVATTLKPNSLWTKNWKQHILLWCSIVVVLVIFVPPNENVLLIKKTILPIINSQWLVYILLTAQIVFRSKNTRNNSILHKWLVAFISMNLIIWASFSFIDFDYFIGGSIVFSTFFYMLFVFFLLNKKLINKIFIKIKRKKIIQHPTESHRLIKTLNKKIRSEKLHINSNLKIVDVSEKLEVSTHELSKLLNENLGKSFTDFINEYRINEAKELIDTQNKYTIEAIGSLSGFNSKSAFYKAFKKQTGTTPAKYKSSL